MVITRRFIKARWLPAIMVLAAMVPLQASHTQVTNAQGANSRIFKETGKTVRGRFLQYWNSHGGLAQQGFPISDEMLERSNTDGKVYLMQYFERAVFEYHPENRAPNDVLLSLVGSLLYQQKYDGNAPGQQPDTGARSRFFPQTDHRIGGKFLDYWNTHGSLAQQGYPISDPFMETSTLDGNMYMVQYFERAVFEYHPEKRPPYDVLLSQLGTFKFQARNQPQPGDQDGDGMADEADSCPNEAENYNNIGDSDGCPDDLQTLIDFAADDINAYWQQVFDDSNVEYTPPDDFVAYTEEIDTACGKAELFNAFYCRQAHTIYYDYNFLNDQLETIGDFAPVTIIAHEWGHLLQSDLGLLGGRYLSVETELQADCLAGAWAKHADEEGLLEEGDLDEAATSLFDAGDQDLPWFDPSAHGPAELRVKAFGDGFSDGPSGCFGR